MELHVTQRNGREHSILFDAEDAEQVLAHTWCVTNTRADQFYAITASRRTDGRPTTLLMHRLLMGAPGADHINHNGLDNRRSNLRLSTVVQNQGNRLPQPGSSAYKGVYWNRRLQRWAAGITINQRGRYLGLFSDENDAAKAYAAAATEAFGEFALLNFPKSSLLA